MCYSRGMSNVGARELRNGTRSVLERVEHGEPVTITVGGRPVAILEPISARGEFTSRADFIRAVIERQADPALTAELRLLAPDTTDDLPDR
jgi:prevent-host-death family protein